MSVAPTPTEEAPSVADGINTSRTEEIQVGKSVGETRATPLIGDLDPNITYSDPPRAKSYGYYLPLETGIYATTREVSVKAKLHLNTKEIPVFVPSKLAVLSGKLLKFPGVELLPYSKTSHLPYVAQSSAIPRDVVGNQAYCYQTTTEQGGTSLRFMFRLRIRDTTFSRIKFSLLPWLKQEEVFINHTFLETGNTRVIGWLQFANHLQSHSPSILLDLAHRFQTHIPFQMTSWVTSEGETVHVLLLL